MDVTFEGAAEPQDGRLFSATGALDEVERLAGTDGDGAWLPDLIADQLGVGPGDTVQITNPEGGAIGVDRRRRDLPRRLLHAPRWVLAALGARTSACSVWTADRRRSRSSSTATSSWRSSGTSGR